MGGISIKKSDERERIAWAEVYAPMRPDSDGEFMDADTIKKMSYEFMQNLKQRSVDSFHNNMVVDGACVVESFIARKGDPDFIEGAWVVGVHVDNDDVWEKIEKGEINGFSVEAWVDKVEVDVELEVPPVISGKTMKADDGHEHVFHVAYNENGDFIGGRTDMVNGHFHVIKRGTLTELSADHQHKFSHVEDIVLSEVSNAG